MLTRFPAGRVSGTALLLPGAVGGVVRAAGARGPRPAPTSTAGLSPPRLAVDGGLLPPAGTAAAHRLLGSHCTGREGGGDGLLGRRGRRRVTPAWKAVSRSSGTASWPRNLRSAFPVASRPLAGSLEVELAQRYAEGLVHAHEAAVDRVGVPDERREVLVVQAEQVQLLGGREWVDVLEQRACLTERPA